MRKLSFLRSLKGCLKSRVACVDFMFMGQCRSLVLERFLAAVAKEVIEKIPLLLLSRNLAQRSVMCREKSRVSAHSSCDGVARLCAQLLAVKDRVSDVTIHQNGRVRCPVSVGSKFSRY